MEKQKTVVIIAVRITEQFVKMTCIIVRYTDVAQTGALCEHDRMY